MLNCEFETKDLGAAKRILGMETARDRSKGIVSLTQRSYIEKILHPVNQGRENPSIDAISNIQRLS